MPRKRTALLFSAVCASLLIGVPVPPAGASPALPPCVSDVVEPEVLDEASAVFARSWGVPVAEACYQLAIEHHWREMGGHFLQRFPATAGGWWLDHEHGELVLAITDPAQVNLVTESIRSTVAPEDVVPADRVRFHVVERTRAELIDAQRRLFKISRADGVRVTTSFDVERNVILVDRSIRGMATAKSPFAAAMSATVPAGYIEYHDFPDDLRAEVCNLQRCDAPYRGGPKIHNYSGDDPGFCSFGFTVRSNTYPDRKYMLTAGHCGDRRDKFRMRTYTTNSLREVGQVMDTRDGGAIDALRLSEIPAESWVDNGVYRNWESPNFPVYNTVAVSSLERGVTIIRSGYASGAQYGEIWDVETNFADNSRQFSYHNTSGQRCGDDGDSGGAIYTIDHNAVGLHNGGSEGCVTDELSYGSHMQFIQNQLNVTLYVD